MTQVKSNTHSPAVKHLTYEEHVKIEALKELEYSNRDIAHILNRAPQTINNAVQRALFVRLNNVKYMRIRCMNTINIPIQLKLTIKRIFETDKTLADGQSGWHVILSQTELMTRC